MNSYSAAGKAKMQETCNRIFEAGYRLYAERVIEPMTMTKIAEASGVLRASLRILKKLFFATIFPLAGYYFWKR